MAEHNKMKEIYDFIRKFNVDCEARGHYFADNPLCKGWQYCEACGAARPAPKETE